MAFTSERLAYITPDGQKVYEKQGAFNSGETLPTGDAAVDLAEGSAIIEPDTGKVKIYDKVNDQWREV